MRHIAICLLGSFEVRIDRQRVTRFEYAKVRALLAYLAVESHRPHTRTWLATLLWPDQPDRAARSNLSQALTTLRNALGDRSSDRPVLLTDTDTVQIDPASGVEVDVAHFLALLRASDVHAQAHRSWRTCTPCADRLRQAPGGAAVRGTADHRQTDVQVRPGAGRPFGSAQTGPLTLALAPAAPSARDRGHPDATPLL